MGWKDLWATWFGGTPPTPVPPADPDPEDARLPDLRADLRPGPGERNDAPPFPLLPAATNPWGVDVVDMRSVTHARVSASDDLRMTTNSMSMAREDGRCFIGAPPVVDRHVDARLRYPVEGPLADGVLFVPQRMEDKWGIFLYQGRLLVVRSWMRQVFLTVEAAVEGGALVLGPIHGAFFDSGEDPALTVAVLDWLVRTHAIGEDWPLPSPFPLDAPSDTLGAACFSAMGRRAAFAAVDPVPWRAPARPLRTDSLLHIAIARGALDDAAAQLDAGLPLDALARDGRPPLTWAVIRPDVAPLTFLLDRGADVNGVDARGFTALHQAAENGHVDAVALLLARGAHAATIAEGHTARSLAAARGHARVVALLPEAP